ncbi:MFS transporter [Kordiimonas laminariae]|uniref:MFS transporter n=1 Tax=Kordiimonas laminariae TaxID=2917717 RepID=UPI001FF23EE5|nr:MFS transporter [Kordiimonas laminariae]MCK0069077.1 MFS transporter [Kordiimonas laminariae]
MTTQVEQPTKFAALLACATIIMGSVLGLAGIDLVLPSVPEFPEVFGTTIARSQLVLAAFVAGSTFGFLLFGSLGSYVGRRKLFIGSLFFYGILSVAGAYAPNIETLIAIRLLQGAAASGSAVLAPGLIRELFGELGAIRAVSAMGSIESLVPGLAPIAGAWLHTQYGWKASFLLTGILVFAICLFVIVRPKLLPSIGTKKNRNNGSYMKLLKNSTYLRYALSHALVLGGLLTFVFAAPAVIKETMGGTIDDFIYMQMVGVASFILFANLSGNFVKRFGIEVVITAGTYISFLGTLALLAYAYFGQNNPDHLKYIFWILNSGLGLRGGTGFVRALSAAEEDDDRASALIILSVTSLASIATALFAPFIKVGLIALTGATSLIVLPAVLLIVFIKPLQDKPE